jgi:prepilin-type processing-associated H-X9-DG protein
MRQVVPTLACPSQPIATHLNDPKDPADTDRGVFALTSYYGSAGTRGYPRSATGRPSLDQFRDGFFDQNKQYTVVGISDGSSNTLMLGERHYFDPVFDNMTYDGGDHIANWGWVWFGAQGDNFLGCNVKINFRLPANFDTLTAGEQNLLYEDRINAFGSNHGGGANFALGDGSVRFIRDSISSFTLLRLGTRAGGEVITEDF